MSFYAGGFIYNPTKNEIFLHLRDDKTKNNPNLWAFFGGASNKNENPRDTFRRELKEETGIYINPESIKALRDYFNPDFNTHRYVFYIVNEDVQIQRLTEGKSTGWFKLKLVFSQNLSKRTREDLLYFSSLLQ